MRNKYTEAILTDQKHQALYQTNRCFHRYMSPISLTHRGYRRHMLSALLVCKLIFDMTRFSAITSLNKNIFFNNL